MSTVDLLLTAIYLGSCGFAYKQGHRRALIIIALLLALIFQYSLGFSMVAKIAVAAIFLLYFVLPAFPFWASGAALWGQTASASQGPSPSAGGTGRSAKAEAIFQDFMKFTSSDDDSEPETEEKPTRSNDKKRPGTSKGRKHRGRDRGRGRSERSKAPTKSNSGRDNHGGGRRRKPSEAPRKSTTSKPDPRLEESRKQLQEEQHRIQREKQRLQEEAERLAKSKADAEKKLKAGQEQLKRDREKLQSSQPSSAPDTRTPEQILGLSGSYTLAELKDARKREVLRWNPSNMVNKPKHLVEGSEEELKKINLAFETLKKKF